MLTKLDIYRYVLLFQAAGIYQTVDPIIVNKMDELVESGITSIRALKTLITVFVENEMLRGRKKRPDKYNRRFYLSLIHI